MKPELMWLAWAVALAFVQVLVAVSGATLQVGLPMLAGNRDNMPVLTGWAGRAQRAHRNQLFVWARLAYAVVHFLGIPWLRTLVWFASVIGMIMIFLQLL